MKIRRFFGSNIRIALRQVTDEFGADAAILSNKKVAGGVEVIAALDYDDSLMPPSIETHKPRKSEEQNSNGSKFSEASLTDSNKEPKIPANQFFNDIAQTHNQLNQFSEQLLDSRLASAKYPKETAKNKIYESKAGSVSGRETMEWSLDPSLQAMKEELGLMRNMMSEQLKGIAWNRFIENDPMTAMVIRRFSKLGIDSNILNSLLPHIQHQKDAECAWQQTLAVLAKSLPIADNDLLEHGGIFALMGPAGVGKTTTIAKLAARFVIKHGTNSVALITTDNYRISAQEQLSTFGRILQLPTCKLQPGQDLEVLLKKYSDKRLILIDTAGVSSADENLIKPLQLISQCKKPIQKLLLMSAASQGQVLQQSLRLFSQFAPDGVILTKLDEAASLGEMLSVVINAKLPVHFTTDGQRIPEDIRQARSHHLVAKAVWLASHFEKQADDWLLAQSIEQVKSA